MENVDPNQVGIAAQGDMASIALFASLIDGKCNTLLLKNPPVTLDAASSPDGRGEALELLNVLQITDVNQLPALIYPTKTYVLGEIPESYLWSIDVLSKLDLQNGIKIIEEIGDI